MTDKDQLPALKAGNKTQFSILVRDHHHALVALAIPIVGFSEAEEVVQIAWIKAYKAIASFEGKSKIRTWLSRIVINEAKMQLRARKKETLFSDLAGDGSDSDALADRFTQTGHWATPPATWHYDSPEALLMSDDLAQCLDRILTAMPNNQRAILEMRDSSELPFGEICNNLSISASNARVLLHRARAHLFKLVDHYQETGEC
ncbi:MAG: sigma-70 family RNA polymerase sigma factor [Pseudomonadales bacterium]|nr:sigma-70 family RNA polymerase sigma factor [Pseudomonadales bacterium]